MRGRSEEDDALRDHCSPQKTPLPSLCCLHQRAGSPGAVKPSRTETPTLLPQPRPGDPPPSLTPTSSARTDRQTDTPRRRPAPSPAGACARPGLAPPLPRSLPQPLAGRGGGRGTRTGGSEGSEGCGAALKPPGRTQPDSAHPRRV